MKSTLMQEIHPKGWGSEKWVVNNENYCGKILHFEQGKSVPGTSIRVKKRLFISSQESYKLITHMETKLKRRVR